jgi:hypothetical protein
MTAARLPVARGDLSSHADGGVRVPRVPCAPAPSKDLDAGGLLAVGWVSLRGDVRRVFTDARARIEGAARGKRQA